MIQTIAHFIGAHGVILVISLLVIISGTIFILRRIFNQYSHHLWKLANNLWRRIRHTSLAQYLYHRYPDVWHAFSQRLSPQGYFGVHLIFGVLLTIVFMVVFTNIADAVVEGEALVKFDKTLATALHAHTWPYQVAIFEVVTSLAGRIATLVIGGVVGLLLLIKQKYFLLAGWFLAVAGKSILNSGLKMYFQRARPEFTDPFLTPSTWSFPSGHAMTAVVLYGMLAYLLFVLFESQINELLVAILVISLVLLIGFSRLYLGVHFFSDVIGGYAAGIAWLTVVISGTEVARRRRQLKIS